jgi:hypothetical protein
MLKSFYYIFFFLPIFCFSQEKQSADPTIFFSTIKSKKAIEKLRLSSQPTLQDMQTIFGDSLALKAFAYAICVKYNNSIMSSQFEDTLSSRYLDVSFTSFEISEISSVLNPYNIWPTRFDTNAKKIFKIKTLDKHRINFGYQSHIEYFADEWFYIKNKWIIIENFWDLISGIIYLKTIPECK